MATDRATSVATMAWVGGVDGYLTLIDQTLLPTELKNHRVPRRAQAVWEAIKTLRVRGAPAIGIAAAYGVVLGLQGVVSQDEAKFFTQLNQVVDDLATSRPTAVNLFWALNRMQSRAEALRAQDVAARDPDRAVGRSPRDRRRRPQGVPPDRAVRRGIAIGWPGRADALQRRRTGHGRLRHGAGACSLPPRKPASTCTSTPTRRGRCCKGARLTAWELHQRGIRRHVDLRLDGGPGDARGARAGRRDRRRSHRRQRRHGQQDRHLWRGGPGRRPRHSVLRRRAHAARSICRSPRAIRFRSNSAIHARSRTASAGRRRPTASTSTIRPSTSRRPS